MFRQILFLFLLFFGFSISLSAQYVAVVVAKNANLREKPSVKSRIIFTAEKGSELKIVTENGTDEWIFVSTKNQKGWVRGEYVDIKAGELVKDSVWLFIGRSKKVNDFSVAFHLNASQIIKNGDRIKFWTKVEPDNKKAYLNYYVTYKIKKRPNDFKYNADLWEGNCKNNEIKSIRSFLYWKNGVVTKQKIVKQNFDRRSNSAAMTILKEACKIGKRQI